MKRIFALASIIALVLSLGMLLDFMEERGVTLISDSIPALLPGGRK